MYHFIAPIHFHPLLYIKRLLGGITALKGPDPTHRCISLTSTVSGMSLRGEQPSSCLAALVSKQAARDSEPAQIQVAALS